MSEESGVVYLGYRPSRKRVVKEVSELLKRKHIIELTITKEGSEIHYKTEEGQKPNWLYPEE